MADSYYSEKCGALFRGGMFVCSLLFYVLLYHTWLGARSCVHPVAGLALVDMII